MAALQAGQYCVYPMAFSSSTLTCPRLSHHPRKISHAALMHAAPAVQLQRSMIFSWFRAGRGLPALSLNGRAVNQRLILRGADTNDAVVLVERFFSAANSQRDRCRGCGGILNVIIGQCWSRRCTNATCLCYICL